MDSTLSDKLDVFVALRFGISVPAASLDCRKHIVEPMWPFPSVRNGFGSRCNIIITYCPYPSCRLRFKRLLNSVTTTWTNLWPRFHKIQSKAARMVCYTWFNHGMPRFCITWIKNCDANCWLLPESCTFNHWKIWLGQLCPLTKEITICVLYEASLWKAVTSGKNERWKIKGVGVENARH